MASGLPGPRPSGVLRTARFAPGESVEPAVRGYRTLAFQASAFDRSATSEVAKPHCLIRNFALRLPFPLRVRAGWPRAFLALALRASFGRPDSLPANLSNPRYGVTVHLLSKQAPSTARPPLRRKTTLSHPELCAPAALPAPREGGMASGLPGPRPSGVLRTARFAPGESVEPAVRGYRTLAFQASAFDRSATSEVAKPHCLIRNFALRLPFPLRVRAGWPRAFLALALRASFGRPDSLPANLSNPRYGVTVHLLSKQAPSTARPPLKSQNHIVSSGTLRSGCPSRSA